MNAEIRFTDEHILTPEFQQSELKEQYDKATALAYKANELLNRADLGQMERDRIDTDRTHGIETGPYPQHAKADRIIKARNSFENSLARAEDTMPSREKFTSFAQTIGKGAIIGDVIYDAIEEEVVIGGRIYKKTVLGSPLDTERHNQRLKKANNGNEGLKSREDLQSNYDKSFGPLQPVVPKDEKFDNSNRNDGRSVTPNDER